MLTVTCVDDQIRIHVEATRRPLMSLDQCALYELAKDNENGARFRRAFASRGDLLLSSINMFELGQLQGQSLERAKRFLDEVIGHAWTPIEFDSIDVIKRELAGQTSPSPYISPSLVDLTCATPGLPTLSKLLEAARHSSADKAARDSARLELGRQIEALRKSLNPKPSPLRMYSIPNCKTLSVALSLFHMILQQGRGPSSFQWALNDAEDFTHSIVGLAHADVVVLDGKWANRVRSLSQAKVFSCGEIPAFIEWCEAAALR